MNEKETTANPDARAEIKPSPPRKPYEAPAWEVEEVAAEGVIVGCAKDNDSTCSAGPIQS